MTLEYLALYTKKCKHCGHLDPEEPIKYEKCHFSNNNTECPAQEIQFAIVGEAKRLADAVKKARSSGDLQRESDLLAGVAKRSAAFQHKFREHS